MAKIIIKLLKELAISTKLITIISNSAGNNNTLADKVLYCL
jgi:hypothetical protein